MRVLIDTNVLARLAQPGHRHCAVARQALEDLHRAKHDLFLVPQVLYELWVVGTRPAELNGLGLSPKVMHTRMQELGVLFRLLRDERAIFSIWEQITLTRGICGKIAHDARLVAAMYRHGLTHILTFNRDDFARFSDITVLSPSESR